MANYDSKSSTSKDRVTRIYSDLDLDFMRNHTTSDLTKLEDVEAVKRSVKNLIQTNHYERPFHPEIGSGITSLLFEPLDPITANTLSRVIGEVITNFEPRAQVVSVDARPNLDTNSYEVTINFRVINVPGELVSLTTMLERSR